MYISHYTPPCPYFSHYGYREPEPSSSSAIKLGEQVLSPSKFSIAYPFIPNEGNDTTKERINKAITNEVARLFMAQALKPEKTDFNEIKGTYEVTLNEKGLLSTLLSQYIYVEHAAHGYTLYLSVTADTETGKIYTFSDLFNPKVNYTATVNELAQKYIKDNNIPIIAEYKGVAQNQQFYLTPSSIVLYYQVYEHTPYAYGLFKIEIAYKDIVNILGPISPIQKLLV